MSNNLQTSNPIFGQFDFFFTSDGIMGIMEDELKVLKTGIVFYKIFSYIKGSLKLLQLVKNNIQKLLKKLFSEENGENAVFLTRFDLFKGDL